MRRRILTINGGSSTVKFAAFRADGTPERILTGRIEGIGRPEPEMEVTDLLRGQTHRVSVGAPDHSRAAHWLIDWLGGWAKGEPFHAVGHRVVHGGLRPA